MNSIICQSRNPQVLADYADYADRLRAENPCLADGIAGFHSIEQVLQWMQRSGRIAAKVDMVGQDEFNYDFLIELEPGGRWLCIGVN